MFSPLIVYILKAYRIERHEDKNGSQYKKNNIDNDDDHDEDHNQLLKKGKIFNGF